MFVWCCILLLLLLQVLEPLMANSSPQPPAISPAAGGQPLGKQKQKAQAKQKAAQQQQQQAPAGGHITMADFPTLDLAAAVQAGDADASALDMRDTVMDALNNLKIGG